MVLNWMWSELCGNLYSHTVTFWDSWIEFKNKLTNQLIMHDDLRDVDKIIQTRLADLKVLLSNPFPYGVPKKSPKFFVLLKFKLPGYNHRNSTFQMAYSSYFAVVESKIATTRLFERFFRFTSNFRNQIIINVFAYHHFTKNGVFH